LAGEVLKRRREDLGFEITEIANLLKIRTDYLLAIENDSFDKLPAAVYTVGYLRSYAKYLKVEEEPIVQYYMKHLSQPPPSMIVPIAFFKKRSPKLFYLLPLVFAASTFFILHPYLPQWQNGAPKVIIEKSLAEVPVYAVAEGPGEHKNIEGKNDHNLAITANDKTWISIKFKDGKSEEMLLHPGDSRIWTFSDKALLKIGNAGGIKIHLNGKDMGSLGDSGQVISLSLPQS
jgi:cytoskeleton protein RodZ